MVLSKRLKTIVDFIPVGVRIIDVGCDHALLDIYLTLEGRNTCIASDINKNVLEKTNKMIASYGLEEKIQVVQSDGLEQIEVKPDDVVVIAGMGASTILHILKNKITNHLIIQSNNDLDLVRKEIAQKGFIIEEEQVVYEKGIYYVIISFKKGYSKYSKEEFMYGPCLLKRKDEVTIAYFTYLLEKKEKIMNLIPNGYLEKNMLKQEIEYLKRVIQ